MGGNAFHAILSPSAFPRLPPAVYNAVKARFLPCLQELYQFVSVPAETPEKVTHGDVDFVVACPKLEAVQVNVPNSVVQELLGAQHVNPMEGNRTSNFAVPIMKDEWSAHGHAQQEEEARLANEGGEIFYQIDVRVCTDQGEWDRIIFFHSYGDMGMIMGLIARNAGLILSEKGLKYPNPPNKTLDLCESFDEILKFLGMSMDAWKDGFKTKREVFEWVGTSRLFDPQRFKPRGDGIRKIKQERKMYHEFVEWAMEKVAASTGSATDAPKAAREEALDFFEKREALATLAQARRQKQESKEVFTGHKVRDWLDFGNYWKGVKLVMDGVRERHGGNEGVQEIYDREGDEGVKRLVVLVKEELFAEVDGRQVYRPPVNGLVKGTETSLEQDTQDVRDTSVY